MAAKTVLEYVQDCLRDMDSDRVDSISDTEEATQVAGLLKDTYYEWIERERFTWLEGGTVPVSTASASTPTSFTVDEAVSEFKFIRYNIDETGSNARFRTIEYCQPEDFLLRSPGFAAANTQLVTIDSQPFYVWNDRMPSYWTTLDEQGIVLDAFKSAVEPYLTTARIHARAFLIPDFAVENAFVPVLPRNLVPALQAQLNAAAFNHFKSSSSIPDEKRQQRQVAVSRTKNQRARGIDYARLNQFGRRR